GSLVFIKPGFVGLRFGSWSRLVRWIACCRTAGLPGVKPGVTAGPGAWDSEEVGNGVVTVFACGDVMPGRGVDQILPHPGDPELREAYARDARAYVDLAERAHGPIPRPAGFCWPWGDALRVLDESAPDV